LVLISLGLEAPDEQRLPGITVYHLPPDATELEVLPALTFRLPTPVDAWATRTRTGQHDSAE
jgi:hypothetical protein